MSSRESWPSLRARPLPVLALALGVGIAWMALELVVTLASGRVLFKSQIVGRMVELLPWQLGLFAGIGAGVALLARWRRLGFDAAVWWVLGAGSFVFLGEALAEGLMRRHGVGTTALALLLLACGLAALAAACLGLGRRLSGRAARACQLASWVGWTLFFLPWMQQSAAAIRVWQPGPEVLVEFLGVGKLLVALGGALLVGLASALVPTRQAARLVVAALCLASGAAAGSASGAARRPDVLVILIDTLRFDHLGANVGVEGLTPKLDALARESILFTRTFSPGNYTRLAVPGVHASLPHPVTGRPLPEAVTTLAEHLKAAGYATYGLSANPYVTRRFGFAQGFDLFLDPTTVNEFLVEGLIEAIGLALPGLAYRIGLVTSAVFYTPVGAIRQRALDFFDASPGPTFVYLQTMDPHGPYLPPHRYLPEDFDYDDFESYYRFDHLKGQGVLGRPEYQPRLENHRQRYRGAVRFTDDELGELIRQLGERGRWDEMLVFLLSDHGEAFGERDWAGHSGSDISGTLVHVPFLVKLPRSWGVAGRVEKSLVSTFDLLPTTLSLLGLPPAQPVFGRDLTDLIRSGVSDAGRAVVSYAQGDNTEIYSVVRWPWKLDEVLHPATGARIGVALYELERDPGELTDLSAAHPERVAELSAELVAWRDRERQLALGDGSEPLDPLVLEQLRKLGYAE